MGCNTGVLSQVESYQRLKKMVLDAALLNTQHHKVRTKSKVEQSKRLPLYLGVVATEKGSFRPPSTTVAKFTVLYLGIFIQLEKFNLSNIPI